MYGIGFLFYFFFRNSEKIYHVFQKKLSFFSKTVLLFSLKVVAFFHCFLIFFLIFSKATIQILKCSIEKSGLGKIIYLSAHDLLFAEMGFRKSIF